MDAVALYPRFGLPSFSAKLKHGTTQPFFSPKEIADGHSPFASRKDFSQLNVLSIRADGNRRGRPPQKNTSSGRTEKRDEDKVYLASNGKTSNNSKNQEEMIALFRRIQSSISKGDSTSSKTRNPNSSQDKPSAESVLEVLRQSRKQEKGEITPPKEENKASTGSRGVQQKVQKVQEYAPVADLNLSRPPSNFVKRSPIPSPSSPGQKVVAQKIKVFNATAADEIVPQKLEQMKLTELKELAKTKGIRGYSKLKKSELLQLLRS